ncbi:MFS transporter [Arenimonas soli]|uniref:MFS transporter n=2 Tax=Arenimonas soli TaxID=2269504 RepID=A0ABQ1HPB8_9GAMM|nr:MFS transporter [Arenimonas soli]
MALTKLGDALASPKTTLAWTLGALGAPAWMVGLLVPVRESGSMLPQLFIAARVRALPRRKPAWLLGAMLQAAAVAGMAAAAFWLDGAVAGAAILGLLVCFSLARGLSSIASKDVLGKTVPKTRRGRLAGYAASASGAISLVVGGALLWWGRDAGPALLGGLLAAAAACWLLGSLVYSGIAEDPGSTEGGANGITEALGKLRLLRDEPTFGRFVLARALLLVSALSSPFLVLLARDHGMGGWDGLPLFLLAAGTASLLSSPFWGRFADRSSRHTMIAAGCVASAAALGAIGADAWLAGGDAGGWVLVGLFFVLGIAHDGVRLGRKTYLVDLAGGNKRTDYVAVSNTAMGVLLLATGAITGAVGTASVPAALAVLAGMGLAGAWLCRRLPEVQQAG